MSPDNIENIMSLILAKNKVTADELKVLKTPEPKDSHYPIPHSMLAEAVRKALEEHGFTIVEEEHALARHGQRYFGGFAVTSPNIAGERRQLVVGLRNSHDKAFSAAIVLGNRMLVCENLCFSSEVRLGRKHTRNIVRDLAGVISRAIARLTQSWLAMEDRITAYENTSITEMDATNLLVKLVDKRALTAQKLYHAVELFRNPALAAVNMILPDAFEGEDAEDLFAEELADKQAQLNAEFGRNTLWTLYNAFTECLKGSDLSKLPQRTMIAQSIFDGVAAFEPPVIGEDIQDVELDKPEQEENFRETFGEPEAAGIELQ
jgi:hypothetical protein